MNIYIGSIGDKAYTFVNKVLLSSEKEKIIDKERTDCPLNSDSERSKSRYFHLIIFYRYRFYIHF